MSNELIKSELALTTSLKKSSNHIQELCNLSENDDAVSFIMNRIKTELDLKTVKMFLKTIDGIRTYYLNKGIQLTKDQLSELLQNAIINPDFRKKCITYYENSEFPKLTQKEESHINEICHY